MSSMLPSSNRVYVKIFYNTYKHLYKVFNMKKKIKGLFLICISLQYQLEIALYESNYKKASLFGLWRCLFAIFECEKALKSNQRGCE